MNKIFKGAKPFNELQDWKKPEFSLIGGWAAKSITFLDNHDTTAPHPGPNEFPADSKKLLQGYAFLLTHPGIPCIFFKHMFEHPDPNVFSYIKKLCLLRVNQNITNQSSVSILHSAVDIYAARINNNTIVKIGDGLWSPGIGWTLELSAPDGNSWIIWKK